MTYPTAPVPRVITRAPTSGFPWNSARTVLRFPRDREPSTRQYRTPLALNRSPMRSRLFFQKEKTMLLDCELWYSQQQQIELELIPFLVKRVSLDIREQRQQLRGICFSNDSSSLANFSLFSDKVVHAVLSGTEWTWLCSIFWDLFEFLLVLRDTFGTDQYTAFRHVDEVWIFRYIQG